MAVPIANMTRGGRRRRLILGVVTVVLAVALGAALSTGGAHRAWRLALFAPLWAAGLGLFQAQACT